MMVEKYLKDTISLPKYIQDRIYNGNLLPKPKVKKEENIKKDSTKNSNKPQTVRTAAVDPKKKTESAILVHHSQVRRNHE